MSLLGNSFQIDYQNSIPKGKRNALQHDGNCLALKTDVPKTMEVKTMLSDWKMMLQNFPFLKAVVEVEVSK